MLFILKAELFFPRQAVGGEWGLVCVCGLGDGNKGLKITMPILVDAAGVGLGRGVSNYW